MSRGFLFTVNNIGNVPIVFSFTSGDTSFDTPPNIQSFTLDAGDSYEQTYVEVSGWSNNAAATLTYGSSAQTQNGTAQVIFDDDASVNYSNGSIYFSDLPYPATYSSNQQATTSLMPYIALYNSGQWTGAAINIALVENAGPLPNPS